MDHAGGAGLDLREPAAPAPDPRRSRGRALRRVRPFRLVLGAASALLVFLAVYPLFAVLRGTFFSGGELSFAPFAEAASEPDLGKLVTNTLTVVGASTVAALVIGWLLAWVSERTDASMGFVTRSLPLVPFVLLPIAGAIGWVLLLSPNAGMLNVPLRAALGRFGYSATTGPLDIHTWYGLIGVYTIYQVPFAFLVLSAGLRNVDGALEEQSRICGSGPFRTLRKVTLPAVWPSVAGASLLLIWSGFGTFSIPAIVGTGGGIEVLTVRIVRLLSFTYPPQTARALGLTVIVVVFVGSAWLLQRLIIRRSRHATLTGRAVAPRRTALGRWRWPVRVVILGYIAATTVLPILALVAVALNGFWTARIDVANLTLDVFFDSVVRDPQTRRSLLNSVMLGAAGATIGVVAAAMLALYVNRSRHLGNWVDAAVKVPPAALPHVVIAVGFVLAFSGRPFGLTGTLLILLLAYISMYLPLAAVSVDGALAQVGKELPEASQISGAGEARTFRKIFLPLMLPGLASGWALLFVRIVGDLEASAILAGTGNPVVGFRILEIFNNGSYADLAALATALVFISGAMVVFAMWVARPSRSRRLGPRRPPAGGARVGYGETTGVPRSVARQL